MANHSDMDTLKLDNYHVPSKKKKRSHSETFRTPEKTLDSQPLYRRVSVGDCFLKTLTDCYSTEDDPLYDDIATMNCPCESVNLENSSTPVTNFKKSEFQDHHTGTRSGMIKDASKEMKGSFMNVVTTSPNGSCMSSIGQMCRICLEGDGQEELISPCRCTGSMAQIHKSCLERWLSLSNVDKCELCQYTFSVKRTVKPFWQFVMCENPEHRRSALTDFICILILTPLAGISLYLCIGSILYQRENNLSSHDRNWQQSNQIMIIDGKTVLKEKEENAKESIEWDIIGLVMLAFLLIGIYMSWLIAAICYHIKVWQRWRYMNQDLVLADTQRRQSRFSVLSNTYAQMTEMPSPQNFTSRSPVSLHCPSNVPCINIEYVDSQSETSLIEQQNFQKCKPVLKETSDRSDGLRDSNFNLTCCPASDGETVSLYCPSNVPRINIEYVDSQSETSLIEHQNFQKCKPVLKEASDKSDGFRDGNFNLTSCPASDGETKIDLHELSELL